MLEAKDAAGSKADLLRYITKRFGEHEADQVSNLHVSDPNGFAKAVALRYMDPAIDKMAKAMGPSDDDQSGGGEKRGRGRQPGSGQDKKKGASHHEVPSDRSPERKDPRHEPIPARPDRVGMRPNLPHRDQLTLKPGGSYGQDVGSAGQNMPKNQPSMSARPDSISPELERLRAELKKLEKDPLWRKGRPDAEATNIRRAEIQARIKELSQSDKGGMTDLQKKVDYITNTYGPQRGDAMAKKYGIPPTSARTTTGSDGKEKIAIWSAEKIAKFMNAAIPDDAEPEQKGPRGQSTAHTPKFDGDFDGQVWSPAGVSQKKTDASPDALTGNFTHRSRFTNPRDEGQKVVWNSADRKWQLPSVYAAAKASSNSTTQDDDDDDAPSGDGWRKV